MRGPCDAAEAAQPDVRAHDATPGIGNSGDAPEVHRPFRPFSVAEQREDCEHAAVVVLAVGQAELLEDRLDVPLDRARAEVELLGDRAVRAAFGDQREDVSLALGELVERPSGGALRRGCFTTSGSNAVPPRATRSTASRNSATSRTRSLSR